MACCCVITKTGSVKVIESFSKFERIAKPGCEFITPCIQQVSGTLSMRLQQMDVECEVKTSDNVFVTLKVSIQYQIIDDDAKMQLAHYKLTNPRGQITNYVTDVIRQVVPKIALDDVFVTKQEIAEQVTANLKSAMSSFGYQILNTPITDIDPNHEVKRAMNEINKMKRLRVAAEDEGEAVKIRAVKEAEAEASRTEIQAKAEAEAKFLGGQGISRQRQAIMEGLRESVNAFKSEVKNVEAKTVMDLMIVTQYFDMMKDVGAQGKTTAVFLDGEGGMSSQIAKGFMSGLPAAPGFAQPMGR